MTENAPVASRLSYVEHPTVHHVVEYDRDLRIVPAECCFLQLSFDCFLTLLTESSSCFKTLIGKMSDD